MAALNHLPNFSSLSSRKPYFSSHVYSPNSFRCCHRHSYSSVYASSKKPRGNKKVKNKDVCNEIRTFLSSVGLPENHVPSLKELSQNGRQDLANVVRRRGYKFVRQLLEASTTSNSNASYTDTGQTVTEGQEGNQKALPDDISSGEAVQETNLYHDDLYMHKELKLNGKSSFALELTSLSLEEKVAKFMEHGELDTIEDSDLRIGHARNTELKSGSEDAHGEGMSSDKDKEDEVQNLENQADINHLEFILHQKELELSQLKRQIEKEELALSDLQTQAETKISNVHTLLSETEIELQAVEECLSGLKEVEIQYFGDGEIVELAGSFNGWHHKIKMDLVPSLSVTTPTKSRTSRLFTTFLWLYPGVYEIKFIVDGRWTIDPRRESVFHGFIHNNILRVPLNV